jgi:hypothetical protein
VDAARLRICGIERLDAAELEEALAAGGRFVFYEYCISFAVLTLRRPTAVFFLPPGESGILRGLRYSLVSLLLGWWGVPWGVIYTPMTVYTNLLGGCDVTAQVCSALQSPSSADS